jgi:hypothetical protein
LTETGLSLTERETEFTPIREARPNDYAFLPAGEFVDLSPSAFDGNPEWEAFTEHCETCEDRQE